MSGSSFTTLVGTALMLCLSTTVLAAEETVPVKAPPVAAGAPVRYGDQTNSWLMLQTSGAAGSSVPQAATLDQRERAATRFLKTYDYSIKESYSSSNFKAGG